MSCKKSTELARLQAVQRGSPSLPVKIGGVRAYAYMRKSGLDYISADGKTCLKNGVLDGGQEMAVSLSLSNPELKNDQQPGLALQTLQIWGDVSICDNGVALVKHARVVR